MIPSELVTMAHNPSLGCSSCSFGDFYLSLLPCCYLASFNSIFALLFSPELASSLLNALFCRVKMSDVACPLRSTTASLEDSFRGPDPDSSHQVSEDQTPAQSGCSKSQLCRLDHLKCKISITETNDKFVDEGYYSPTSLDSEKQFAVRLSDSAASAPSDERPLSSSERTAEDLQVRLPKLFVTDEKGITESVDLEGDEHGQLWDFARDKIARRMFLVRANKRAEHLESTFYSDLYSVSIA